MPGAGRLGGEERLEGPPAHLFRHARSRVGDRDQNVVARCGSPCTSAHSRRRDARPTSSIVSLPPSRHRVPGVDRQIEQGVLQDAQRRPPSHAGRRRQRSEVRWSRRASGAGARRNSRSAAADVGRLRIERLCRPKARSWAASFGAVLRRFHAPRRKLALVGIGESGASISRLAMITVRILLKSCATPPVSWPTASIFCDCRSSSSIFWRLVRSRMKPVKIRCPSAAPRRPRAPSGKPRRPW